LVVRELGVTIPTFPDIGEHLKYGMPLSVSALAGTLSSRVDRILIGFFLGASAVGVYSIAYQLAIAISVYVLPIRQTFFPEFSRLIEKGDAEQCVPYLKKGVRYFLLLSVPSVGAMYLIGPSVVQTLIGDSPPLPSNILMALIAGGILFSGLDQIYGVILTANERTDRLSAIRMVGAIGNLFLNLLLIQWFGVIGAAVATLVTYMLTSAAVFQEISVIKPPFSVITFIRTALAASAMVAGIWLLNISSIWLTITAGVLVYFSISFLLGEIEPNEIKSVLG
jgi:O-antigen/teichoic acid export membrane protein